MFTFRFFIYLYKYYRRSAISPTVFRYSLHRKAICMKIETLYLTANDTPSTTLQEFATNAFYPTLAIAFVGPQFPFQALCQWCKSMKIELVGCTGSGEIIGGKLKKDGASLMLLDAPPSSFRIYEQALSIDQEEERSQLLGAKIIAQQPDAGIFLLSSGVATDGVKIIKGLKKSLPPTTPVFGGMAGDNLQNKATYAFTSSSTYSSGLVAIAFHTTQIALNGTAVSGWQPVGKPHIVTEMNRNVLMQIDHQPALDLFTDYFGPTSYSPGETIADYIPPTQIPLQLQSGEGKDTMRTILRYDHANRGLVLAGSMEEGSAFKFCPIAKFGVMNDTINQISQAAQEWEEPDGVVLIQCLGRHYSFGPLLQDEVENICKIWDKPSVGFLSNGEFGPDPSTGRPTFHNITISLMTIRER